MNEQIQILVRLKQGTSLLHKQAEQHNLARYILDHSITAEQYRELLQNNFVLYKAVETIATQNKDLFPESFKAFISTTEKSDKLKKDLEAGQISTNIIETLNLDIPVNFPSLLGAIYVIEGSMLGGLIIQKHITNCEALKNISEHHFFGGDQQFAIHRWKQFCDLVQKTTFTQTEIAQSVSTAKIIFEHFIQLFSEKNQKIFKASV